MISEIIEGEKIKVNKIPTEFVEHNNLAYLIIEAFRKFENNRNFYLTFDSLLEEPYSREKSVRLITFTCPEKGLTINSPYIPATSLTEEDEYLDIDMDYMKICPDTYFL